MSSSAFSHRFSRSGLRRMYALVLCVLSVPLCAQASSYLTPRPGLPDYQALNVIDVPGAFVNAAGGNLMVRRTDITADTVVGVMGVGATYNAATGEWLFDFDMSYDGTTFVDPTGASYDVTGLAPGDAIPGSVWVFLDARNIASKGGLRHEFDGTGRLVRIRWASTDLGAYPSSINYTWGTDELLIQFCTTGCQPLYRVVFVNGRPTTVYDERNNSNRRVRYFWDAQDRLEQVRDPLDIEKGWPGFRYEYNGTLLTAITNSEGERIEYAYYADRSIQQVRQVGEGDPTHGFQFLARNVYGVYPTIHTNPVGEGVRYAIIDQYRLKRSFFAQTGATIEEYTWSGLRPATRDVAGEGTTTFTYVNDDVATRTEPSGNAVAYTYAPTASNREPLRDRPFETPILRIDDSLGPVETRTYTTSGFLKSITNGAGETESYTHGVLGLFQNVTRADGPVKALADGIWTLHGHPTKGERGWGTDLFENFAYDPVGNKIIGSSGLEPGNPGVVQRSYDGDRNLVSITYAAVDELGAPGAQETVTIEYRSDGRPTRILRPNGANHEFGYDAIGRLVSLSEPVDGILRTTTFEYDAYGRRTATERPNGMREEIEYGWLGVVSKRRVLRDGLVEGELQIGYWGWLPFATYDSVRDAYEWVGFDGAGRVNRRIFAHGETLTIGYDLRSRKTSEVFSLDDVNPLVTVEYEYDGADREVEVRVDGEPVIDRTYTDGLLTSVVYGNGLERTFTYHDERGTLETSTTVDLSSSQIVEDTTLSAERKSSPSRTEIALTTTTSGGVNVTTQETYVLETGDGANRGPRVYAWKDGSSTDRFAYSPLGNRASTSSETFTYNAEGNRMLSAPGGSYTWDEAGFATSRHGAAIAWNADGLIAQHGSDSFTWDMRRRLLTQHVGGATRDFSWFDGRVEVDSSQVPIALDLGEARIGLGGGDDLYRHLDVRRNVKFVTDQNGDVVAHYRYAPYGVDAVVGSGSDDVRFVERASVASLTLLGERVYDPAVGRFLSPGSALQISEQYTYAHGNPVQFSDPDGRGDRGAIDFGLYATRQGAAINHTLPPRWVTMALAVADSLGVEFSNLGKRPDTLPQGFGQAPKRRKGELRLVTVPTIGGLGAPSVSFFGTQSLDGLSALGGTLGSLSSLGGLGGLGGIGCAPTQIDEVPHHAGALVVLLGVQALIGIAVLRRRRRRS